MFNPVTNAFTKYVSPYENIEIQYSLQDKPINISSWANRVLNNGNIIAKANTPESEEYDLDLFRNFEGTHLENEYINNNKEYKPLTNQEMISNGKKIIDSLMSRLNLTKEQASGIVGVISAESGCNPNAWNKAEKSGKLPSSSANGSGYGAGMLQWSNERKKAALKLIGKQDSLIESLSLDDQINMLIKELEGPYKSTLSGIRKSKTASEAAATMYCHNVGGFSSSDMPATQDEITELNKKYSKFGNRDYVGTGMNYAEQFAKI